MTRPLASVLASLLLSATLGGCALFSRGEALAVRWYDPERFAPRLSSAGNARACTDDERLSLELGRVASSSTLRERIAYRERAFEVGFYDERRWTERPEAYVRRALARALFEERCFRRTFGGAAPVLEVEVVSFEEVLGPPRTARVRLRIVLRDDRDALLEDTIIAERPVLGKRGFDAFVQAMSQALEEAANTVAGETARTLRASGRAAR